MDRDTLRIELGKLGALFRAKQSGVDEQVCKAKQLGIFSRQARAAPLNKQGLLLWGSLVRPA
eukprot:1159805-Pelagomonas_calceolata.AAC.1